jgi:GNAT superfamily N-acetyltransferase
MKYILRKATEKDFVAIHNLIHELAVFEKASGQHSNSVQQMIEEQAYFNAFVVENQEGEIIAMALYFIAYFTWVGKSLYLDDLYVKKEFRGEGIGKMLIDKIFEIAKKENCKRLRWQVLDWNTPAIDFYEKLGAKLDAGWINCDFSYDKIRN